MAPQRSATTLQAPCITTNHEAEQDKSFLCASWRLTQLIESERAITIYIESAKQRHCIIHRHLVVIPQGSGLETTAGAEREESVRFLSSFQVPSVPRPGAAAFGNKKLLSLLSCFASPGSHCSHRPVLLWKHLTKMCMPQTTTKLNYKHDGQSTIQHFTIRFACTWMPFWRSFRLPDWSTRTVACIKNIAAKK